RVSRFRRPAWKMAAFKEGRMLLLAGLLCAVGTFFVSTVFVSAASPGALRGARVAHAGHQESSSLSAASLTSVAVVAAVGMALTRSPSSVVRRAVPNTPKSSPDTLAGNRTEASAVSRPYDKFNDNYPLSSPDQKRTEVTTAEIPRPEDLVDSPKFPLFGGSANGYMSKATRERHAITWTAKEEATFEMPTSGWAMMNKGENLCYFRKKEQCIALCKQLRSMKINDVKIYRLSKDGEVTFLHPSDGVFPEKVNKGRVPVNFRPFTVCQNAKQGELKFTEYWTKPYEADALTTLFVKARVAAYNDVVNLFPLPNPKLTSGPAEPTSVNYDELTKEAMESQKKRIEAAMASVKSL
ncbi:Photosystem I psaD, partial [Amphidinium carterae]